MPPETRYAKSGDVNIAWPGAEIDSGWQEVGDTKAEDGVRVAPAEFHQTGRACGAGVDSLGHGAGCIGVSVFVTQGA